jgi:hypothetical protein
MSKISSRDLLRLASTLTLLAGLWAIASLGGDWSGTASAQTVPTPPLQTPGEPIPTLALPMTPTAQPAPPSSLPSLPCLLGVLFILLLLALLGFFLLRRRKGTGE